MEPLFLLFIDLIIAAVIAAVVAIVTTAVVMIVAPPLVMRPLARIEFLDAHPRHICRGDTVTANWRGFGDSGILVGSAIGPFSPFHLETLAASRIRMGNSTFAASVGESFEVTLELRQGSGFHATRAVTISNHSSPNSRIELTVPLTFTLDPRPGWFGTKVFQSNPMFDSDDWSPSIQVTGLEYPAAFVPPGGGPRPTRDTVRDVMVFWGPTEFGTLRELATLTVDHFDHFHVDDVTVVGEWRLFVVAGPDDGPHTVLQSVTIRLMPRCARG